MSESYDVIIVGAGTAGCVLADRLTMSGKLKVLLLEAGGFPKNRFISVPAGFAKLFKSEVDWHFESEPQDGAGGRRIFTPRGKMLGGCANMNAMIHQWCHPADFDGWRDMGAEGWAWEDVAPVFKSMECLLGDEGGSDRGRTGPMFVTPNRNARSLTRDFVVASRKVGLGNDPEYNGRAYQGAWVAELAHKDGRRFSCYDAFLKPAMRRKNLNVMTDAHVVRLVIENRTVSGVKVRRGGVDTTYQSRGVALTAGALASPQLLLLSGLGPQAELGPFGIDVVKDLPQVGKQLQEHPILPMVFKSSSQDTLLKAESLMNVLRYLVLKKGMLASNGAEGIAFTQIVPGHVSAPDLELIFLPFEHRSDLLEPPTIHAFSIGAAVVAPKSRGQVTLQSDDPHIAPKIDFGLLTDPEGIDARVLWGGVSLARDIAGTMPLAAQNLGELRPGSDVTTEDELLSYAAEQIQTVYHPSSTCSMGSTSHSVVDSRLKLRGFEGLWVADASVMPTVPRGHPNAVVAMIAERAAGWIQSDLG
ncbi:MAG: GMC family oxidoreductase N-terminal domain-containing protein [Acidobacteria bacterium]|nr:GMC family oxidoreductase N-terminal domain-containing protein [Acidobacteriota bacterium]